MKDRRSGEERRATSRYRVEVVVEWQGSGDRQSGTLSDVSLDGCFVLCSGNVQDGEQIKIYVPLADGMKVEFRGGVTNHVYDIGFGLKFDQISGAQRDLLSRIVREADKA